LAQDWHEAQDVYQVQGWKSCVLLCGRILEAIILDALSREADADRRELAHLVEAATAQGILRTGTPYLGPALREFRRLIHPGRPKAERIEVTRDEAEAALIAVRMSLRQLGAEAPKI
jgi:nucleotide-binding universal stress UspA family protein